MQVVIGLGNPEEPQYVSTRHNAGALFVNYLQEHFSGSPWQFNKKFNALVSKISPDILLVKPQTFMNLSGQSARAIMDFYQLAPADFIVALDDLDLPLGEYKFQQGRGPHGHNGLENIYQHLSSQDFPHLRLGIDTRAGDRTIPPANYVLQPLFQSELASLHAVFGIAAAKSLAL